MGKGRMTQDQVTDDEPMQEFAAREFAAKGFAAMGSAARLAVLRTLIRAGEPGLTIGALQERTGIAPSTLAHHMKSLAGAGLVTQERQGRSTINRASFDRLEALAAFILSECCADQACGDPRTPGAVRDDATHDKAP